MFSSLGSHAKELKQQGAINAAQDEDSNVTAADAEKIMVNESKKGGAVAFQFDPDASPEAKAEQAGAVIIPPEKIQRFTKTYILTCSFKEHSRRVSSPEEKWNGNRK
jgi:hypothetical protein